MIPNWFCQCSQLKKINTKKAFKKPCIFILRCFELFLIRLQSKNKATLGNASKSKPKDSVTQEITVWCKRRQKQNQYRQPCQIHSQWKQDQQVWQKVLKQNLNMIVIYVNKAKTSSKRLFTEHCKQRMQKFCLTFSSSTISMICLRQHQQQCTQYVLT